MLLATAYLQLVSPYLAAAALVLALGCLVYAFLLTRRLKRLALGRTGSIEESVNIIKRELDELKTFRVELQKYLKTAEARLRGAVTGIGVVRFNPFEGQGQGGNQSAAVALMDERGVGVVLSTLYSRDRVAVYAKPIDGGKSEFELTAEEKAAITKAKEEIAKLTKST
ncbi:MAG: DUF4446 family protein [Patescibacteria group bacterium]